MKKYLIAIIPVILTSLSVVLAEERKDPMVCVDLALEDLTPSSIIRIGESTTISTGKEKELLGEDVFYGKIILIKATKENEDSYQINIIYTYSEEPSLDKKKGIVTQVIEKKMFLLPVDDKERKIDIGRNQFLKVKLYLVDATGSRI